MRESTAILAAPNSDYLEDHAKDGHPSDDERRQHLVGPPGERDGDDQRHAIHDATDMSPEPHDAKLAKVLVAVVVGLGELPNGLGPRGVIRSFDRDRIGGPVDVLNLPSASARLAEPPALRTKGSVCELASAAKAGAAAGLDLSDRFRSVEHLYGEDKPKPREAT
jgi:hypothetical protein